MRAERLRDVEIPPDVLEQCEQRRRDAIRRMKPYDAMPRFARAQVAQSVHGHAIAR